MAPLQDTFRIAIFDQFLDAFAAIPRAQQKGVQKFMRRFRADPTSNAINYESISTFKDPNLKTVRIDQAYRAIVLKPEQGNVYVLLWVDHHDKAMAWAKNKILQVHPETGSLQVFTAAPDQPQPKAPAPAPDQTPTFEHIRDRELLRLGVPEALLPQVRAVMDPTGVETLREILPPEAFEALFFIAEGDSLEDVEEALAIGRPETVDTADFGAALERAATQRRFALVEDDRALEAMLDAPLERWRTFLHPAQKRLVNRTFPGSIRVLGGAGTGKTVVAMHRARYLASEVFTAPGARILMTTYTVNLAADIRESLSRICDPEVMARIQVQHLDGWVSDLLERSGYRYTIAYWNGRDGKLRALWDQALEKAPEGFPRSFFREEWEGIIQPEGILSFQDYKKVSRAGRGTGLNRAQRKAIWPVFEAYRDLLEGARLRESAGAMRDAAALLREGTVASGVSAVVVDEAQDMGLPAFKLIRQIVPEERENDLFIVGDAHQRIYDRKVVLSHAGINVRGRRGRRLRINYRTTDEIRAFAVAALKDVEIDDLDGGADTTSGYRSLLKGTPPTVHRGATFEGEVDAIAQWLRGEELGATCLVARTNALVDAYGEALKARGIPTYRVRRSQADDRGEGGLRLATMHRVKGLEFDRVIIAGANKGILPLETADLRSEDAGVRLDAETRERALLYVALTRAKRAVLITGFGEMSGWV